MLTQVPRLNLTHGQVAWVISSGQPPSPIVLAQLRYLRTLGIPFGDGEKNTGRGNRVAYSFYNLMEIGVAFEALRKGVAPRHLKQLVEERKGYEKVYRACYRETPEAAYTASWVKSRGREITMLGDEYLIYIQGRFAPEPGRTELVLPTESSSNAQWGDMLERLPGQPDRVVIQLKRLMVSLLVWAAEAPEMPRGPKG